MSAITSVILALFAGYCGLWYFGVVEGNFSLLLLIATVVTGIYWLAERFFFLPQRLKAAASLHEQATMRLSDLARQGITEVDGDIEEARAHLIMQPWWLDWTAGLFPVIVVVFLLRSFLFEPFKIPSASMVPTLLIGDLILVNKYTYGIRLPVINLKLTQGTAPQRGDVMVFRYPPKPSQDYIKRVVGLPGDEVAYLNKRLTINGQAISKTALPDFFDEDATRYAKQFEEVLGARKHRLLNDDERGTSISPIDDFSFKQNCRYSAEGVVCKVPDGQYFMMGDNRDNSLDSRYWGFVPDQNIVGRAFFVWMNFSNIKRFGSFE
jgi:signal peptidase I